MAEKKKTTKKSTKKTTKAKKKVAKPAKAEKKVKVVKKEVVAQAPVVHKSPKPKKLQSKVRYYGTGRRKEAAAKVWLVPGQGKITVNDKDFSVYFCGRQVLEIQVKKPLEITNTKDSYDVIVEAFGGGVPGQAVAASMGIARALITVNPEFRKSLKSAGLLRRDPRMKERKKYGRKRARKSFQYTKR